MSNPAFRGRYSAHFVGHEVRAASQSHVGDWAVVDQHGRVVCTGCAPTTADLVARLLTEEEDAREERVQYQVELVCGDEQRRWFASVVLPRSEAETEIRALQALGYKAKIAEGGE